MTSLYILFSWIKQVSCFLNPSCSSSNSKNWLNTVLFTICKKMKLPQMSSNSSFFLKITNIMRFWSDLGQIKPRNERNMCISCLKRPFRGSEVILELKIWIFHHFGGLVKWQFRTWKWVFTRQTPILVPDGPTPKRKSLLDTFWRVFFISGLYFAWNWPEIHFLRHFIVQNCQVAVRKQI